MGMMMTEFLPTIVNPVEGRRAMKCPIKDFADLLTVKSEEMPHQSINFLISC